MKTFGGVGEEEEYDELSEEDDFEEDIALEQIMHAHSGMFLDTLYTLYILDTLYTRVVDDLSLSISREQVLGLEEGASKTEIDLAFRTRVLESHPDVLFHLYLQN